MVAAGGDGARPVFAQVNLVCRDFDATVDFYRRLGVAIPDSPLLHGGTRHVEIEGPGGTSLELDNEASARMFNAGWRGGSEPSRVLLGFRVPTREAVDACYEELVAAGHAGRQPPFDAFWGARYAIVVDPDGHDVGLMSPIEDDRRSWPPTGSPELA